MLIIDLVVASIAISIALLTLTPNLLPASQVFGNVTDGSGWGSRGFSFLIGFLSVAWTMTDYDATTHISEETRKAAIRGPVAITQAVIISGVRMDLFVFPNHMLTYSLARRVAVKYLVWFLRRRWHHDSVFWPWKSCGPDLL